MHNSEPVKIVLKGFMVAVPTLLLLGLLYICAGSGPVVPATDYFYDDFICNFNGRGEADILVLGNSRALASLSSKDITKATGCLTYNMAYRSGNIKFTRDLLRMYLRANRKKPRICILEVSWFTFSTLRTRYPVEPTLVLRTGSLLDMVNNIRYDLNKMDLVKESIQRFRNGGKSAQTVYVDYLDGDPKGREVMDPATFNIKAVERFFPNLKAGINPSLLKSFRDIVELCRENDIELILFTAPELPKFTEIQRDKAAVKKILSETVRNNALIYLDFTVDGSYYSKELDRLLLDSHHVLNSKRFTQIFLQKLPADLIRPALRDRSARNGSPSTRFTKESPSQH